jgi:hypothetical protein
VSDSVRIASARRDDIGRQHEQAFGASVLEQQLAQLTDVRPVELVEGSARRIAKPAAEEMLY